MFVRSIIRTVLRPVADVARRVLSEPEPEITFGLATILDGPAKNCQLVLPDPSVLTRRIVAGEYEPVCTKVIKGLVGDGDVCFDIGGHYGYYTFSLAKIACHGHVHTFEPVPDHAERLREGVQKSELGNVTIHQSAMSREPGEMQMRIAGEGADDSMAYLTRYGGVETEAAREQYATFVETTVETHSLDTLALDAPRFIKIDAEGAEAQILQGGMELIRRERPRLLVEVHGVNEALQCSEALIECDYIALILSQGKEALPILWVHREDLDAIRLVEQALGFTPTVVYRSLDESQLPGQS